MIGCGGYACMGNHNVTEKKVFLLGEPGLIKGENPWLEFHFIATTK